MLQYKSPKLTHHKSDKLRQLYNNAIIDANITNGIVNPSQFSSAPQMNISGYEFGAPSSFNLDKYISDLNASKVQNSLIPDLALGYTPENTVFEMPDPFDGYVAPNTSKVNNPKIRAASTPTSSPANSATNNATANVAEAVATDAVTDAAVDKASTSSKLRGSLSKLWDFAKANPGKAIGAGTLGAGNLAGLLDNEYWGGQAIGGGLGALGGVLFKTNPYATAMLSMGGGMLGSLFDKLRAKKAEEQALAQQYGGGY